MAMPAQNPQTNNDIRIVLSTKPRGVSLGDALGAEAIVDDDIAAALIEATGYRTDDDLGMGASARLQQFYASGDHGAFNADKTPDLQRAIDAQTQKIQLMNMATGLGKLRRDKAFTPNNNRAYFKEPHYDDRLNMQVFINELSSAHLHMQDVPDHVQDMEAIDASIHTLSTLSFHQVLTNHPTESNGVHNIRMRIALSQASAQFAMLPADALSGDELYEQKRKLVKVIEDYHLFMTQYEIDENYHGYTAEQQQALEALVGGIWNAGDDAAFRAINEETVGTLARQYRNIPITPKGKMNTDDESRRNAMFMELIMDYSLDLRREIIAGFENRYGDALTPERREKLEEAMLGMANLRDWNADADGKDAVTGETMGSSVCITRGKLLHKMARNLEYTVRYYGDEVRGIDDVAALIDALHASADYILSGTQEGNPAKAYLNHLVIDDQGTLFDMQGHEDFLDDQGNPLPINRFLERFAILQGEELAEQDQPNIAWIESMKELRFLAHNYGTVKKDIRQSSHVFHAAVQEFLDKGDVKYPDEAADTGYKRADIIRNILMDPEKLDALKAKKNEILAGGKTGDKDFDLMLRELRRFKEAQESPETFANIIVADAGGERDSIGKGTYQASLYEALLMASLFDLNDKLDIQALVEDVDVINQLNENGDYLDLLMDPVFVHMHLRHRVDERQGGMIRVHSQTAGSDMRRRGSDVSSIMVSDMLEIMRIQAKEAGEFWKGIYQNVTKLRTLELEEEVYEGLADQVTFQLYDMLLHNFVRANYNELTGEKNPSEDDIQRVYGIFQDEDTAQFNGQYVAKAEALWQKAEVMVNELVTHEPYTEIQGMFAQHFGGFSDIHLHRGGPKEGPIYRYNEVTVQGAGKEVRFQNPFMFMHDVTRLMVNQIRSRFQDKSMAMVKEPEAEYKTAGQRFVTFFQNKHKDLFNDELRGDRKERFANELFMFVFAPADLTAGLGNTTARGQRGVATDNNEGTVTSINTFNESIYKTLNMPTSERSKSNFKFTSLDATRAIKQSKVLENLGCQYNGWYGLKDSLQHAVHEALGVDIDVFSDEAIDYLAKLYKEVPEMRGVIDVQAMQMAKDNSYDSWQFMPEHFRPRQYQTTEVEPIEYKRRNGNATYKHECSQASLDDVATDYTNKEGRKRIRQDWSIQDTDDMQAKANKLAGIFYGGTPELRYAKFDVLNFVAGFKYEMEEEHFRPGRELIGKILARAHGLEEPKLSDDFAYEASINGSEFMMKAVEVVVDGVRDVRLFIGGGPDALLMQEVGGEGFPINGFGFINLAGHDYTVPELLSTIEMEKNLQLLNFDPLIQQDMRMEVQAVQLLRRFTADVHTDVVIGDMTEEKNAAMTLEEKFGLTSNTPQETAENLEVIGDIMRSANSGFNALADTYGAPERWTRWQGEMQEVGVQL